MRALKPITIDFETYGIMARPQYPPVPVGVSVKFPGKKAKYYAWGHPTENNCTKEQAACALRVAWESPNPLLFHNAKFDYDVATTHMGMPATDWSRLHDTLLLVFLDDPHASSFALKPSAQRILGMEPEERDAVRDWLIDNQSDLRALGLLPDNARITAKNYGAWICLAPGGLVGKYADGDVLRTEALFAKLHASIIERGMGKAYARERQLMPILLRNERQGVRFDAVRARKDSLLCLQSMENVDRWLRKTLKRKDLNIDSDADLAEALLSSGAADEGLFMRTAKGALSVAKESLIEAVTNRRVLAALQYRSKMGTFAGTFLQPWAEEAERSGGWIFPAWNQVKQFGFSGDAGAKTGRLSASRFMNTPKEVAEYAHPTWIDAVPLPFVREYVLPDKGELWAKRDYSQQEFRILAHYEDGVLLEAFKQNPHMDVHVLVSELIGQPRSVAKTFGFGLLYGMGIGKLAEKLKLSVDEAGALKREYMAILPGLKILQQQLKQLASDNEPFHTWGGREYYCEEPKEVDGCKRTFEYKMLNYLIQGSAADCTKQALINYDAVRKDGRFLITVHDEINISVPKKALDTEMKVLREAMLDVQFDVPMLSDGKVGANWGNLSSYKEQ